METALACAALERHANIELERFRASGNRSGASWGGMVDITMNRAPHFGRVSPTMYFAQGFSGHGVNTTGLAGKLIAEAINGQASRFDLFGKIRHRDFPGGATLRTPALVLAMAWYRMKDFL